MSILKEDNAFIFRAPQSKNSVCVHREYCIGKDSWSGERAIGLANQWN
jgi:hypothetical protein